MGLILPEPIEKVVEIPKVLMKMSVEDEKNPKTQKIVFWGVFSTRSTGDPVRRKQRKQEKTGRGRKQRIKNEYRAAPRRFRVSCSGDHRFVLEVLTLT
jgi:hypothetical protein